MSVSGSGTGSMWYNAKKRKKFKPYDIRLATQIHGTPILSAYIWPLNFGRYVNSNFTMIRDAR